MGRRTGVIELPYPPFVKQFPGVARHGAPSGPGFARWACRFALLGVALAAAAASSVWLLLHVGGAYALVAPFVLLLVLAGVRELRDAFRREQPVGSEDASGAPDWWDNLGRWRRYVVVLVAGALFLEYALGVAAGGAGPFEQMLLAVILVALAFQGLAFVVRTRARRSSP